MLVTSHYYLFTNFFNRLVVKRMGSKIYRLDHYHACESECKVSDSGKVRRAKHAKFMSKVEHTASFLTLGYFVFNLSFLHLSDLQ